MRTRSTHAPRSNGARDLLRHYIGDIVYGANDGLITTFAIVSGAVGAHFEPRVLIIIGLVSLFADGFSMGASNYLAIRSVADAEKTARGRLEPLAHAGATFLAFVAAGLMPLIAWFGPVPPEQTFPISAWIGAATLFGIGSARSLVTGAGAMRSGAEMLAIGAIAAFVAYQAGGFLEQLIS